MSICTTYVVFEWNSAERQGLNWSYTSFYIGVCIFLLMACDTYDGSLEQVHSAFKLSALLQQSSIHAHRSRHLSLSTVCRPEIFRIVL